ncbi:MAG: EAL domain-containing protein, partial [bacterium]|nr:EAL domain-containing protein [bacterium]
SSRRRLLIETGLRLGLARNEYSLRYQPIWNAKTHGIVGVEALLRWNSAELGPVEPDEFVPVAEEVGLIRPIGFWVLREACRQGTVWRDAGYAPIRMCVNVSPHQLLSKQFVERVRSILEETGFEPAMLDLELTERGMLDAESRATATLADLERLGVRISIDDFGMGYSSLRYLKTVKAHTIKIDRYFVNEVPDDAYSIAVAESIISLAHSIGVRVVAEGVETLAQCNLLQFLDCDELQGFYLARPLPAQELAHLLERV